MTTLATTLLTLLLAAPVPGRPAITTRVTAPPRLTVGDRFEMTLTVTRPPRGVLTGPLADTMGVFAVAGETRNTRERSGLSETTYRLSMAAFQPGRHRIPPFTFLVSSGSTTDTLRSDTVSVTVASVLPAKMSDVNALKPAESFPNYWLWAIPGALALLAALAWAGRRLYRRLKRHQELALAPLPPWEEALNALDAMPWGEWLEAGNFKRYYYALSEVLKRYIERRFEFGATEQTTTEMLAAMRLYKTPMRDDVTRFFTRSDLVKYSKVVPSPEEARAAIGEVREFVVRTKPQEPAAAEGAADPAGAGTGA